jgi:hypothetical protein
MHARGKVVKRLYGAGSKSEHEAVMLDTGSELYRMRRRGGNPFRDPQLDALVGSTIECEGTLRDHMLIVDSWRTVA